MKSLITIAAALLFMVATGCTGNAAPDGNPKGAPTIDHSHHDHHARPGGKLVLTDDEWKKKLTPEQYRILREAGTERPGTGALLKNKKKGVYRCGGCGAPLFTSETKYNSGSGWPSFYDKLPGRVAEKVDTTHGMIRTEVLCDRCGGHLGHKFPDGPNPTGQRYCINSLSLEFEEGDAPQSTPEDGK